MNLNDSNYLVSVKPLLIKLLKRLNSQFAYASILAQDSVGIRIGVSRSGIRVNEDTLHTKRGFVVRVHNEKALAEYSFDEISENLLDNIVSSIQKAAQNAEGNDPIPKDDPLTKSYSSSFTVDPDELGVTGIVDRMTDIRTLCLNSESKLLDAMCSCSWQKQHKLFLSEHRDLCQNILWFNASLVTLASDGNDMKDYYVPFSGLCGAELLDRIDEASIKSAADVCVELLSAGQIVPGEYECICDPETTGMIVHEAFGHGVEMDMFVKDRALARSYIGKKVASPLVTMHDGAMAAEESGTFLFDDEGCEAQDNIIIKNGILIKGYADSVSAGRLHVEPTGNGRRESFERKAYTRMTNTFFEGGHDSVDDMIASIKYGFLLENPSSGMEDPKNWGIQCMVNIAREIKDGHLTGKVFTPIIMTGYVPDLLNSISMLSETVVLGGGGYCGKGYKEFVKVSDGGPYIKARVRLG